MQIPSSEDMMNTFKYAISNPFGLEFGLHKSEKEGRTVPYITLGSAINCLGYNDYLERVVGIVRIFLGLMGLAFCISSEKRTKEAFISALHIFRGILETMGTFERELLIVDVAFTIINLIRKTGYFNSKEPEQLAVTNAK